MKKVVTCEQCTLEMTVVKKAAGRHGRNKYKITRWGCVCGHTQTIYGQSARDQQMVEEAKEEIEIQHEQERQNRR
jgi:hypothetical protein